MRTRGRLAPSPTGAQHVGNARTYLLAWLSARAAGGSVVLRIEDIDSPRIKPGAAEEALVDLHWLGLDWDGEPLVQTQRLPFYKAALQTLKDGNLVYPCTCTRTDVVAAASAPHGETEPTYPGTCAGRTPADAATLVRPYCWRFRITESPAFDDLVRGPTFVDLKTTGGDFVVWKAAGTPAYQLAVVVDDAAQAVTEVVRGDDLVPSTPRQLLLYQALGFSPPRFAHVPLVVGPDGRRLAKRHGDTRLGTLRAAGVSAETLVGVLAWSCGLLPKAVPVAPRELIARFTFAVLPRQPFVFAEEMLRDGRGAAGFDLARDGTFGYS